MNHVYRVVWSAINGVWQVVSEHVRTNGKSRSAKALAVTVGLFGSALATAADLPVGGIVTAGSGTISQSGNTMTVTQETARMAADWQSFSIGQGYHVNFVQPSASAVALNRVMGSDVSVIQGSLTANGHVFLINPNGVLFTPTAQVNVGGIVASTQNINTANFMQGNYTFEGSSNGLIVNQGNITAANGGTIALIAAKVINDGSLTANAGNVLLGAGSKVTLDLGGPVKLQVENDVLETLISNGGAIKADGGTVLLTSQAAANLASSVINNTGVIEAQTLATGEQGEIVLFAHDGTTNVAGKLDASAPNGGDGGFIETSGASVVNSQDLQVTTLSSYGQTGNWLIDPLTYTVAASGGDETGAALTGRLASTNIQLQADNLININDAVSWSANKLTLTSGGNININANLTATGTASLAFEYGQGTTNGVGSSYNLANGAKVYIPAATAFTWKKGSASPTNNLVFNNGNLRFGDGTQASLNSNGLLEQPWYYDNTSVVGGVTRDAWYKLTFSNFALNMEVGAGGDGSSSWNRNGSLLDSQTNLSAAISNRNFDISGYNEGKGVIVSSVTLGFAGGESVKVDNTYTLAADAAYVKIDTNLTNVGANAANNMRLWVGTQDDYVATRDSQYKYKGNLTGAGFEQISLQSDQAKALKITEFDTGEGAAILFYSTSDGADTSIAGCCSFTNATGIDPRTSAIWRGPEDGSYALFIRLQDLGVGQNDGMTWYYAAAPAAQLNSVVNTVAQSAGVASPAPTPVSVDQPSEPQQAAIQTAQSQVAQQQQSGTPQSTNPQPFNFSTAAQSGTSSFTGQAIGSLDVIQLQLPSGGGQSVGSTQSTTIAQGSESVQGSGDTNGGNTNGGNTSDGDIWGAIGNQPGQPGLLNVYIAGSGLQLPDNWTDEE